MRAIIESCIFVQYFALTTELNKLGEQEWVIRCSARLHARWPRIGREQRDETTEELWRAGAWRELEPEQAAAAWIDLGAPVEGAHR